MYKIYSGSQALVVHAFIPSTQELEADGSLSIQGHPGLYSEFQDGQDYTEKHCLKDR